LIGLYQFAHVLPSGELLDPLGDRGEPAEIRLQEGFLADAWYGQGIEEGILRLVAKATGASEADERDP
jgi:hypothetical protein